MLSKSDIRETRSKHQMMRYLIGVAIAMVIMIDMRKHILNEHGFMFACA